MQDGVALRNIARLFGKSYKAGEVIPGEVLARMTPQALRAAVNNRDMDVAGMEADGGGIGQHLKAKIEKQAEEIKAINSKLAVAQQANDDLAGRVSKLEGVVTALMSLDGKTGKQSRREQRAGAPKE